MPNAGYVDDPTVPNDSELWRRIPPKLIVLDENMGRRRPSSAAFKNSRDGSPMSVFLADVLRELNRGPETVLAGHDDFALAAITAGLARECNQSVARDPLQGEPAHAVVIGKKTEAVRTKLALGSHWIVLPPQPQRS